MDPSDVDDGYDWHCSHCGQGFYEGVPRFFNAKTDENCCETCREERVRDAGRRERALKLYKPPFRREHGYIYDSNNEMVADETVLRVRGWGRIQYLPDAPELQDAAGDLIAEALTKFWTEELGKLTEKKKENTP